MSLKAFLAALNPFVQTVESDLDKAAAAVRARAEADIVALRAKAAAAAAAEKLAAKRANLSQFVKDYEAYLAATPAAAPVPVSPAPAATPGAPSVAS